MYHHPLNYWLRRGWEIWGNGKLLKCHHPSSSRSAVPRTHVPAIRVRRCLQLLRVLAAALIYFVFGTGPAVIGGWGELMTSLVTIQSDLCPKASGSHAPQPWQPKDKTVATGRPENYQRTCIHVTCSCADMCLLGLPAITWIQNNNNTEVQRKVRLVSSVETISGSRLK